MRSVRLAATIEIACAPHLVWPWLVEPDRVPRWWTKVKSLDVQGGGPLAEGRSFIVVQQWKSGERVFDGHVVTCRAPDELVYRVAPRQAGASLPATIAVRLENLGWRTRLDYVSELEPPPGSVGWLFRLLRPFMLRAVRSHLVPLKELAESGRVGPPS